MLRRCFLSLSVLLWCAVSAFSAANFPKATSAARSALAALPLRFEANQGQWDPQVRYAARSNGGTVFLTAEGPVLSNGSHRVNITLLDQSGDAQMEPLDRLPAKTDYFIGRRDQWRPRVSNFERVAYRSVYPGIDVVYYGSHDQLEYDFVLQPGSDSRSIRLRFGGADHVSLTPAGDLSVECAGSRFVQKRPVIYQEDSHHATRRPVDGRYELLSAGVVGIRLGPYDRSLPLVVDPVVTYSAFVGGSAQDVINVVTSDAAGFLYVAGYTQSSDLPPMGNAVQTTYATGLDGFVAIIDSNYTGAASLVYLTYLGGGRDDAVTAITLDANGLIYVTGTTTSSDFPLAGANVQTTLSLSSTSTSAVFPTDAFVTIISRSDGLEYSTYYGGTGNETPNGITVDRSGLMYILGTTDSPDLPVTTNNYQATQWGPSDLFIAQIDRNSTALLYSSYLGGEARDDGRGLAVAPNGFVYFAASTFSTQFPMSGPSYRTTLKGVENLVVGVLDLTQPGANALLYATYLGGSTIDEVRSMSLDSSGRLLLAGWTLSNDFPVTSNAFRGTYGGAGNGFVALVNPAAQPSRFIEYATFIGGSGGDVAYRATRDASGAIYVTGYTLSTDFPTTSDAAQQHFGNGIDGFLVKFNPAVAGSAALQYGTYFGGVGVHVGKSVVVAATGAIYVGGYTTPDLELPKLTNTFAGGSSDGFVVVLK